MKKRKRIIVKKIKKKKNFLKFILLASLVIFFLILWLNSLLKNSTSGNVALIPLQGLITVDGKNYLGKETVSSEMIIQFLKKADKEEKIKAILLEINSPGGSAVASDEIATQIKKIKKPVIALIKEQGTSGGYWIASASDYLIANRMSLTGSIGVLGSYLEFSGLLEKYGVTYQRLVSGEKKDLGSFFRKLTPEEKEIIQQKLNKIHQFFIEEVAQNRNLSKEKVKKIATGEFFLGIEALKLGLIDELGDRSVAEDYLKKKLNLRKITYARYEPQKTFLASLIGVVSDFFFKIGEGLGSVLVERKSTGIWLV